MERDDTHENVGKVGHASQRVQNLPDDAPKNETVENRLVEDPGL